MEVTLNNWKIPTVFWPSLVLLRSSVQDEIGADLGPVHEVHHFPSAGPPHGTF